MESYCNSHAIPRLVEPCRHAMWSTLRRERPTRTLLICAQGMALDTTSTEVQPRASSLGLRRSLFSGLVGRVEEG